MVGFGQGEVIQASGLIQLEQEEARVAGLVQLGQYQKAQVVGVVGLDQEMVAQAAGIWACSSQGDGKW